MTFTSHGELIPGTKFGLGYSGTITGCGGVYVCRTCATESADFYAVKFPMDKSKRVTITGLIQKAFADNNCEIKTTNILTSLLQYGLWIDWVNNGDTSSDNRSGIGTSEQLFYEDSTLFKVLRELTNAGLSDQQAINAVHGMQNAGILFRERVKE